MSGKYEDPSFEDLEVISGDKRVVWEWIGEGYNGDYNEADPDDVPLLRFTCDRRINDPDLDPDDNNVWEGMQDASYCTLMPIDSPKEYLLRAAGIILDAIRTGDSYKRHLEQLSWFCPADFEEDKGPTLAEAISTLYTALTDACENCYSSDPDMQDRIDVAWQKLLKEANEPTGTPLRG